MQSAKFAWFCEDRLGTAAMAISDIALFGALKTRMNWLQQRQTLLAENVANADTPGYRARDLAPVDPGAASSPAQGDRLAAARTHAAHLRPGLGLDGNPKPEKSDSFEVRPRGNSVGLEEEMMKVSETQLDYQLATGLYSRGIGILKTALGRRA
jgi:flagellar basal-body rod protein FlgB